MEVQANKSYNNECRFASGGYLAGITGIPRVVLADDHLILIEALAALIEPEFQVVGRFPDGNALLEAIATLHPHVVVLDIGMPLLNGMETARKIRKFNREIKIIFLTMNAGPDLASEALRIGASGYLLKTSAASELALAIRLALRGGRYLTPRVQQALSEDFIDDPDGPTSSRDLTPREKEVLQLLAEGRSMKEAAGILKVQPRTIAFHKYRMKADLRLKSNADLFQYAFRRRIIQ